MKFTLLEVAVFINIICSVVSVDRSNFKTCDQATFCKRHRKIESNDDAMYFVDPSSVFYNGTALELKLIRSVGTNRHLRELKAVLVALTDSRVHLLLDQVHSIRPRYQPLDALAHIPAQARFKSHTSGSGSSMMMTADGNKIIVQYRPFRVDVYSGSQDLAVSINSRGLLKFEEYQLREEKNTETNEDTAAVDTDLDRGQAADEAREEDQMEQNGAPVVEDQDDPEQGVWEETFKTHRDSKPHGPSSVGMDITFVGYQYIYGLPEHADNFALKSTTTTDPYRLYNLDVFEYELNNPMALYGSIPYVVAHNTDKTVSMLWLNAAETWVDVKSSMADRGVLRTLVDKLKPSKKVPQVDTHWISESGLIDLYIFLGPRPADVFRQYSNLTGVMPLPPLFALGYHQCRWNYKDEEDVAEVHAKFDEHDLPLDVIWLDIEHTDGKKYFTWDPIKFAQPRNMIGALESKKRKMVTIIDPHIKKDDAYHVYKDAKDQGYFVKDAGNNDYDGHCWPGASMYLDFLNPAVRDYWASKFAFDQYIGSTESLFTWNDMNEPSVFSGPEVTMHKDAKHFGGWEHRDVHNIYGFYHHESTFKGQFDRSAGRLRPFVLTRAFFVGSQRTTAVWTGDNMAEWSHLKMSIPMLLSLSVAGIPLVGADVGGFFHNPDEQLLVRWYQAGAFQPFFRAHAHIDTKRREPWLFSGQALTNIREAIRRRYALLPFWYTLFYEHTKTGLPPMRPLWLEFPNDELAFDEEREWLVGNALLVRPVFEADVQSVSAYLPGKEVMWYDWDTDEPRPGPGAVYVDTPMNKIPVFQRGGSIVPVRERVRRASALMIQDPITLYIAANYHDDYANGTLYADDGETYEYQKGNYLYMGFEYKKENAALYSISSRKLDVSGKLNSDAWIERIVIRGLRGYPQNVHLYFEDYTPENLQFEQSQEKMLLVIRKPGIGISQEFRIDIHL